jgi:hypothetical protein
VEGQGRDQGGERRGTRALEQEGGAKREEVYGTMEVCHKTLMVVFRVSTSVGEVTVNEFSENKSKTNVTLSRKVTFF